MRRLEKAGRWVAALVLAGIAGGAVAQDARLLVLAKKDEELAVVDPASLKVMGKIAAGSNPHEVIASSDGQTAWITNYGNGALNTITRVDVRGMRVLETMNLQYLRGPHGLAFADGRVWFTAEREKLIGRLNAEGTAVEWVLGTGQTGTHMLWVAQDGTQIVAVNVGSGTLDLFQRKQPGTLQSAGGPPSKAGGTTTLGQGGPVSTDWDQWIVKVGGLPEGFDVLTDKVGHARTIWAANAKEGTISVVDFSARAVTGTIDAGVPTANRLRFTPDGRLAVVSREKSGEVTVLDVDSRMVVKRINVGTGAAGVLVSPDGIRAFVSCSPDDKVTVIDLKTLAVTGTILPGREPDGLAWAR